MKLDLTVELGRLLNFTAQVAVAIRMYSAYNQSRGPQPNAAEDLMWLSDSLHNFSALGTAVQGGNPDNIIFACDMLSRSYKAYQEVFPNSTRQAKPTFERNANRVSLNEAIAIFEQIRLKAITFKENS
jgi:hypothetical protein